MTPDLQTRAKRRVESGRANENYIVWQCHLCGEQLYREDIDPDGPDVPVTPVSTMMLIVLLDGRYAKHLRESHRGWHWFWRLRGRPKRDWFA